MMKIDVALREQRQRVDRVQSPEGAGRIGIIIEDAGAVARAEGEVRRTDPI